MSAHTPGPWEAQDREGRFAIFGALDSGDAREVASVECDVDDNHETTEANAKLIAAAPDLLAMCERLLALVAIKYGNLHLDTNLIQDAARAAIAKARGQ